MITRLRRRSSADDGFTLIELTVAMVVTILVMSSLVIVFLGSIRGVALAKQRQAATGLATATMEQLRALDYGTLSSGLYCSDLTGDANVTVSGTCGAGGTATLAPAGTGISETVKVQTTAAPANPPGLPPIYPHVASKTVEKVAYNVAAYVTISPTTPSAFNLTVLVSWSSSVTKGTKSVTERSTEFSPSRCLSSATHPYSGACQAAFNGDAGFTNALISVTDPTGSGQTIPGFGGTSLQLALGSLSSTLDVEQITKLTGKVQTQSATSVDATGSTSTGGATGVVSSDSDPSTTTGGVQTGSATQGSVSTLSISGAAGTLSATPSSSGSGSLDAEVASTATSCQDGSGTVLAATQRPCTWGTRQSSGTGTMAVQLPNGAPNFTIASVGAAPSASRATVAIVPAAGGTACPTASGAGCVTAQSSRSLGTVSLGGLPTPKSGDSAPPPNWTGSLLSVTGVTESAYSESGIGARTPPTFTRSAGTLTYYDPSIQNVRTLSLSSLTSDTTVNLAPLTATFNQGGHQEDITLAASFTAGGVTAGTTSAPDTTCKSQACTATATPSSTLRATITYTIAIDGVQTTSFTMSVDLGACIARSSYTAAFDA